MLIRGRARKNQQPRKQAVQEKSKVANLLCYAMRLTRGKQGVESALPACKKGGSRIGEPHFLQADKQTVYAAIPPQSSKSIHSTPPAQSCTHQHSRLQLTSPGTRISHQLSEGLEGGKGKSNKNARWRERRHAIKLSF
jgi:hypothetical protein